MVMMLGHGRQQIQHALHLLLLCAAVSEAGSLGNASTSTSVIASIDSSSISTSSPHNPSILSTHTDSSTSILEKLGRFLSKVFPRESEMQGDGGLFPDGASIAWGGSTLEVVKTQASYLTRAAAFGPRITSDEGLKGGLLPVSDFYHSQNQDAEASSIAIENFGCPYKGGPGWRDEDFDDDADVFYSSTTTSPQTSFKKGGKKAKPPSDWIALIERGGKCSFVSKVRVAQALGAKAVVVGDAAKEGYDDGKNTPEEQNDPGLSGKLVTMYAPGDTSDVHIPSTFVTRPSYIDLIRLIDELAQEDADRCMRRSEEGDKCDSRAKGLEVILERDDIMWEWPLIDLAFILLLLPSFMTMATIVVHRIRLSRQRRRERAPEMVVLGLPCLIWRPDGQPWEKVEGSETGVTGGEEQLKAIKSKDEASKTHQETTDMELGNTQTEGDSNQAGPSTTSTTLKTIPVAPPAPIRQHSYLPPGRTYFSCDECAICLSEFVDGDLVRVLPCGHVFHLPEIDSWLLRVKKLCPICKRDITVPIPPTPPAPSLHNAPPSSPQIGTEIANEESTTPSDNEQSASEETPLLARNA